MSKKNLGDSKNKKNSEWVEYFSFKSNDWNFNITCTLVQKGSSSKKNALYKDWVIVCIEYCPNQSFSFRNKVVTIKRKNCDKFQLTLFSTWCKRLLPQENWNEFSRRRNWCDQSVRVNESLFVVTYRVLESIPIKVEALTMTRNILCIYKSELDRKENI